MFRLLTEDKLENALRFCENSPFGLQIASRIKVYGSDSRYTSIWFSENSDGSINTLMNAKGAVLNALFSPETDFTAAYELAQLSGAGEIVFDSCFAENFPVKVSSMGDIMFAEKPVQKPEEIIIADTQMLHFVYSILFEHTDGDFDLWYTENSHRIRHGISTVFTACNEGRPVSCATVLSEDDSFGLISDVATYTHYRCCGYAGACVAAAVDYLSKKGKTAVLFSVDERSTRFYSGNGFSVSGKWCEIIL